VHAKKLGVVCCLTYEQSMQSARHVVCLMYDMPGGLHALLPYALHTLSRKTKQVIALLPNASDALSKKFKEAFLPYACLFHTCDLTYSNAYILLLY